MSGLGRLVHFDWKQKVLWGLLCFNWKDSALGLLRFDLIGIHPAERKDGEDIA